jgi:hypothetical protein
LKKLDEKTTKKQNIFKKSDAFSSFTNKNKESTTKQLLSIISTDRLRRLRKLPQGRYFSAV